MKAANPHDALVALFINQFPALRMTYLEDTLPLQGYFLA